MLPLVNDPYLTLTPYVPGKPVKETERELSITGAVKLASNENPYGPSPKAVAALREAITSLHDYPDGGAFYLRNALSEHLRVSPQQLVFGNGTNEIIEMLVHTCLRPGENVLYANPSFIVYKLAPQAKGAEIRDVPLTRDLKYDLHAMAKVIDAQTKLVFLGNPNNPTGTYITKTELETFLAAIPESVIVVMDEAYFEYASAPDYPNGLDYLKKRDRLVVLRTFSKAYGLAGLRVGYGVMSTELADYVNRGRQPFNLNSLAQVGALAALSDEAHVRLSVSKNKEQMARLVPELTRRKLYVWESQANFVLVDFHRDGHTVFQKLLREGVIVRPMGQYGLPNAARITIGTPEQNDKLLVALDKVLGS